jgi:hypothetical protein
MADYFLVLDAALFAEQLRPALAASWRQRSFAPCQAVCAAVLPAARAYAERYHVGADEPLVSRVVAGLSFDRVFWRSLVGELLLFAATEIPEFQTCEETLVQLLAPGGDPSNQPPRPEMPPIMQAHRGSRDLTFGAAVYRPEHAGLNDRDDVARLAEYLASVRPVQWTAAALVGMDEEDADDEIEFAREWFPELVDLFRRVNERGQVIVHERMY